MTTVKQALAEAKLYTDNEPYVLVKLPAAGITVAAGIIAEISHPFTALIVDKDEVTLIIPPDAIEEFGSRLRNHAVTAERYRLITLDVVLPPDMVGFMAEVSAALAAAGVTIFPYAAYSRDHLLVPEKQLDAAMNALKKLKG